MSDVEPTYVVVLAGLERRERWHGVWKIEFFWPLLVIIGLAGSAKKISIFAACPWWLLHGCSFVLLSMGGGFSVPLTEGPVGPQRKCNHEFWSLETKIPP